MCVHSHCEGPVFRCKCVLCTLCSRLCAAVVVCVNGVELGVWDMRVWLTVCSVVVAWRLTVHPCMLYACMLGWFVCVHCAIAMVHSCMHSTPALHKLEATSRGGWCCCSREQAELLLCAWGTCRPIGEAIMPAVSVCLVKMSVPRLLRGMRPAMSPVGVVLLQAVSQQLLGPR